MSSGNSLSQGRVGEDVQERFQRQADDITQATFDTLNEDAASALQGIAPGLTARFARQQVPVQPAIDVMPKCDPGLDDSAGATSIRRRHVNSGQRQMCFAGVVVGKPVGNNLAPIVIFRWLP